MGSGPVRRSGPSRERGLPLEALLALRLTLLTLLTLEPRGWCPLSATDCMLPTNSQRFIPQAGARLLEFHPAVMGDEFSDRTGSG